MNIFFLAQNDIPLIPILIIAGSVIFIALFLFFVQDRLGAPAHAGPMLVVFFLAAAASAPFWGRAAERFGIRQALLAAMAGAIVIFAMALTLGEGDWLIFYLIVLGSGAAMGADMTLFPAMLARRLSSMEIGGEAAFSLWGFVNKASLALAAGLALPALDLFGFNPGGVNAASALTALSIAYAGAPCLLKAIALAALAASPDPNDEVQS